MKIVKIIIVFVFVLNAVFSNSQDAVFSQFYHNPPSANPALTGIFNGKNRAGTILRNQWYSVVPNASLTATNIFYDLRLNILNDDYLGIGVMVFDDKSGVAKIGKTHGYLNLSYSKRLTGDKYRGTNQYLVFGAQFGYGIAYLDNSGFLFGSQFNKNTEVVEPGIESGENLSGSKLYPDINMGLMWYGAGRRNSYYLGGAVSHLNMPDISLIDGSVDKLKMRYSGMLGGEFGLGNGISLLPSLFFNMQGQIIQSVIGSHIRYEYFRGDENAVRLGLWMRLTNSVSGIEIPGLIFSSIIEFNNIEIGLSYDVTLSNLNYIDGYKGAFELSLIYIWGKNPRRTPILCPRF